MIEPSKLAKLLIRAYYSIDPQKFALVIKFAVLREAENIFISGVPASLHELLRTETLAVQLFKFGVLCYDKTAFLSLFKDEIVADEFSFLAKVGPEQVKESEKIKESKNVFDLVIDRAHNFYRGLSKDGLATTYTGEFMADLKEKFTDVVSIDELQGRTEVLRGTYTPEKWEQIRRDFDAISRVGNAEVVVVNNCQYRLPSKAAEQEPLLDDADRLHCCSCRCM